MIKRIACILFLALLLAPHLACAQGVFGVVDFVPDGDTVVFKDGTVVRMLGIDAPETGKDGGPGQYFAEESRTALEGLVLGTKVEARFVGKKHDAYGRLLAVILLPDGRNANELQLLGGFAFYYHFESHPGWLAYTYLGLQRSAMRKKAGFWPRILHLPGAARPWVGFPGSRRAEPARGSRRGAERAGLVWFKDLEQAFWQGYAPTRKSTPWPGATP